MHWNTVFSLVILGRTPVVERCCISISWISRKSSISAVDFTLTVLDFKRRRICCTDKSSTCVEILDKRWRPLQRRIPNLLLSLDFNDVVLIRSLPTTLEYDFTLCPDGLFGIFGFGSGDITCSFGRSWGECRHSLLQSLRRIAKQSVFHRGFSATD